ncbi:TIGR03089 family protein [Mycobacteriaceae bacterium 1482268.1]|nr:TIGR03089 family protein [Mycobacteriaceae bacterium 1482268.1]
MTSPGSPRGERSSTLSQALLDPLLNRDPVGPRITYYDDATGERIELSTVTLANWAAKTANLLRDELGAGPHNRIAVLLPAHWQTAAVLLGIWYIGAEVVLGPGEADVALCTGDRLADADAAVGTGEIAVLSLDPFGKAAADVPVGVTDYATSVRAHGDQIVPEPQPGPALDGRSIVDILTAATESAATQGFTADDRVLSTATWDSPDELIDNLLAPLAAGASLVQVANPEEARLDHRRETEKVTKTLMG